MTSENGSPISTSPLPPKSVGRAPVTRRGLFTACLFVIVCFAAVFAVSVVIMLYQRGAFSRYVETDPEKILAMIESSYGFAFPPPLEKPRTACLQRPEFDSYIVKFKVDPRNLDTLMKSFRKGTVVIEKVEGARVGVYTGDRANHMKWWNPERVIHGFGVFPSPLDNAKTEHLSILVDNGSREDVTLYIRYRP